MAPANAQEGDDKTCPRRPRSAPEAVAAAAVSVPARGSARRSVLQYLQLPPQPTRHRHTARAVNAGEGVSALGLFSSPSPAHLAAMRFAGEPSAADQRQERTWLRAAAVRRV